MTSSAALRALLLSLLVTAAVLAEKTLPRPILMPAPTYPTELLGDLVEGQVIIQMTITEKGRVEAPAVKSSDHEAFSRAALKALAGWKFEPATQDGKPISQRVNMPFNFKPSRAEFLNKALGRRVYTYFAETPVSAAELPRRPRPIERPRFQYPPSKAGSGEEMRVPVRFIIGKDGATYNPTPVGQVDSVWALPAIATVASLKFEPVKLKGELVLVEVEFPILLSENPPQRRAGAEGSRAGGGRGGGGGYLGD